MDYIKYPPERLYRRFTPHISYHHTTIFDIVDDYINIVPLSQYIDASDPNRLRNLLNYISNGWEKTLHKLHSSKAFSKGFSKSKYKNHTLCKSETPLSCQEWNEKLNDFINNDVALAFFVIKYIILYVFPD